jgi:hypothetical protein
MCAHVVAMRVDLLGREIPLQIPGRPHLILIGKVSRGGDPHLGPAAGGMLAWDVGTSGYSSCAGGSENMGTAGRIGILAVGWVPCSLQTQEGMRGGGARGRPGRPGAYRLFLLWFLVPCNCAPGRQGWECIMGAPIVNYDTVELQLKPACGT